MTALYSEMLTTLKRTVLPVALIILCITLMAGATWYITQILKPEAKDPNKAVSHTIVLVDQTDALSGRCIKQLQELIANLPETIQKGERLSIFSIHANSDIAITPLLSVYNPGLGYNEWVENVNMKKHQFMENFMNPIIEFSENIKNRPPSPTSPIIETVNRILSWKQFSSTTPKRKIIIYSDMIQNSTYCSDYPKSKIVYKGSLGCAKIKQMNNVDVDIRYIIRPDLYEIQTIEHQARWMQWIREAGAKVTLEKII